MAKLEWIIRGGQVSVWMLLLESCFRNIHPFFILFIFFFWTSHHFVYMEACKFLSTILFGVGWLAVNLSLFSVFSHSLSLFFFVLVRVRRSCWGFLGGKKTRRGGSGTMTRSRMNELVIARRNSQSRTRRNLDINLPR